jgi:hypothetical protein
LGFGFGQGSLFLQYSGLITGSPFQIMSWLLMFKARLPTPWLSGALAENQVGQQAKTGFFGKVSAPF